MKRKLTVFLVLVFSLLSLSILSWAEEENPIKVAMQLSQTSFTEPGEITVSIKVSNAGSETLPGPVTLVYPNGKQVEEFGAPVLDAGASKSWTGTLEVTQSMLDAGRITFKIKYSRYNENGELISLSRNFFKEITYTGSVASVEVNRTIAPTTAGKNQEVSVTYDIINTGTVEVRDVTITEKSGVASKPATISRVEAGKKSSHTFTFKMGSQDVVSQGTITYTAGGEKYTVSKESVTIKYGEMNLRASLSADRKGGLAGDTVKLTLKLSNSGKTDYHDIVVTDPVLGEVFTGQTAPAGKTTVLEKEITVTQSEDYQFTVTALSGDDSTEVETVTERVSITALDPDQAIVLEVQAGADRDVVYQLPGTVRFRVFVTNKSASEVKNVTVSASGVNLYTFPSILAGETRDFTRDVHVSMAGKYQFVARTTNPLGEAVNFESNILQISHMEPTPVPTEAPIVTPPRPVYLQQPTENDLPSELSRMENILGTARNTLIPIFGVFFLLTVIALIRRGILRHHSKAALDHLERGGARNYSLPGEHANDTAPETENPEETSQEDQAPEPDPEKPPEEP